MVSLAAVPHRRVSLHLHTCMHDMTYQWYMAPVACGFDSCSKKRNSSNQQGLFLGGTFRALRTMRGKANPLPQPSVPFTKYLALPHARCKDYPMLLYVPFGGRHISHRPRTGLRGPRRWAKAACPPCFFSSAREEITRSSCDCRLSHTHLHSHTHIYNTRA
jgi:hypothetical protein